MSTYPAVALLASTASTQLTEIDWIVIAIYFAILLVVAWWVVKKGKDSAADYFLGRPQSRLVDHRRVDLRVEHRLGARRRTGGSGRHQRRCAGPLRTARLVLAGAGLGLRSVLHALHGLHHAGVSGAALQLQLALRALHRFDHYVHRLENCSGNFCRRRGLRHAAAGAALHHRQYATSTASGSARCW